MTWVWFQELTLRQHLIGAQTNCFTFSSWRFSVFVSTPVSLSYSFKPHDNEIPQSDNGRPYSHISASSVLSELSNIYKRYSSQLMDYRPLSSRMRFKLILSLEWHQKFPFLTCSRKFQTHQTKDHFRHPGVECFSDLLIFFWRQWQALWSHWMRIPSGFSGNFLVLLTYPWFGALFQATLYSSSNWSHSSCCSKQ